MVKTCKIAVFIVAAVLVVLTVSCSKSDVNALAKTKGQLPAFVQQQDDKYLMRQGDVTMELSPSLGGRISSLKHLDHEMLVTHRTTSTLWGSVLWSSPQSDWNWPPVEVLDIQPYHPSVENDRVVLTSDIDKKTGYQFVKSYGLAPGPLSGFSIRYSIYNRSNQAKAVAPWELTRVPTRGTILFPAGDTDLDSSIFYPLDVPEINGIRWFHYDTKKIRDDHHKMMTDSRGGWLAYVDQGYLLLKEFEDVPVELIATHEGEVELFADANKTYLEIQEQGGMTMLQPDEHLEWEVVWHLQKLPPNISTEVGSEELVSYIRELIAN